MEDEIQIIWQHRAEEITLSEEITTLENAIRMISLKGKGEFSKREYRTTLYHLFIMKDRAHAKLQHK